LICHQLPNSSLGRWNCVSAEQQHRSIVQADKAVAVDFPEKVKIRKKIKNSQRMVGQRSPASRRKRFRFLVLLVAASNSRRLIVVESETAMSMSEFGGESRRS
jgi:hypothetical protein